ncbi:permease [Treponema peruense]|uniref:Permease n=1 Tax=Treponema peruense TaxID=2787628 RepID=A0A7T3RFA7_9SPIR|nr:permease [Treponema peruense]
MFPTLFQFLIYQPLTSILPSQHVCGGGTVPLLQEWLYNGMSAGSAAAFMITGPATKITNLGALKTSLGIKHFVFYILFVFLFSLLTGVFVNLF